jgi:hypothetical protein
MDITLTYAGSLPPRGKSKSGLQAIWNIRNVLSPQLEHFYTTNPVLNPQLASGGSSQTRAAAMAVRAPIKVEGFDFVAIARPNLGLGCRIDMDMLVNHQPGSIITHGGDLDNRIKTLFDALRVPRGKDEIKHYNPWQIVVTV